jgi:NitT/TauT family transport system permease protein
MISAFNAIPIIALAPVANNWFGMGMGSKIAVVAVFTMATMAINVYRGLNVLKPFSQDLMLSYAADKKTIFVKLRLPNSLPNILTALKICSTSSIMAAIISEFFSSFQGIGFEMSTALKLADMSNAWAYILIAAVFGIVMYSIILLVERYAMSWHTSQR